MRSDNGSGSFGVPYANGIGAAPPSGGSSSPFGNYSMGGALLGGGLAGLLGNMFGNQQNPSANANQYLNQVPGAVGQYMQPYMQAGGQAVNSLQGQYSNLLNNPGGQLNQIGQGFHQSPGFQFALQQAMQGANHAAGAGGMAGSPQAMQQNMGMATQLGNQDYYNWLQQAQGMYGAGLQGQQGLAGLGMQGSTNMTNAISAQLGLQAAMAYQQAQAQNQAQGDIWGDIGGGLGAIAGTYFGGPAGAAAGWKAGQNL